jgi:adenine/guanine/hypoxanthine permease
MLNRFFKFEALGTNLRQETLAGLTTFLTIIYLIVVNPKILEAAGIPFGPSMVATILTVFFGTMLMGVYAKRPFAIAPYMGQNAFVAYTLVKVMGYPWQVALGGIFISGLVFAILTLTRIRAWLVNSIPHGLKVAFSVGLGFFLCFIGLNVSGIVQLGVLDAPVRIGNLTHPEVLLAVLGFLLISLLMIRKINGALFIGMMIITFLSFAVGMTHIPHKIVDLPPDIGPILGQLDVMGALDLKFLPIVLLMFIFVFVDTMGTLIGVSNKAGFLDQEGNLPEIEKPMLCDSLSTMFGAFVGTTTSGVYVESLAGIEAGGRSGFTSVVTALLFLSALFFAPLFSVVPAYAYGPALIVVGMLMMSTMEQIKVQDLTELIPILTTIVMITFTYNLGIGMTAGFVIYPVLKVLSGRHQEVSLGGWILGIISLLFFMYYPY